MASKAPQLSAAHAHVEIRSLGTCLRMQADAAGVRRQVEAAHKGTLRPRSRLSACHTIPHVDDREKEIEHLSLN